MSVEEHSEIEARPSLRARVATRMARVAVKHWARGDPPAVVRRARWVLGYPSFLSFVHSHGVNIEKVKTPEIRGEWISPTSGVSHDKVVLYLHGGGYVSCSSRTHRPITTSLARLTSCRVFALDYRWAPEHPFPAAVDDAAAAFLWLVTSGVRPNQIAIAGD